jgi:hypothetical protein
MTEEELEKGALLVKRIWKPLPEVMIDVDINEVLLLVNVVDPVDN